MWWRCWLVEASSSNNHDHQTAAGGALCGSTKQLAFTTGTLGSSCRGIRVDPWVGRSIISSLPGYHAVLF